MAFPKKLHEKKHKLFEKNDFVYLERSVGPRDLKTLNYPQVLHYLIIRVHLSIGEKQIQLLQAKTIKFNF